MHIHHQPTTNPPQPPPLPLPTTGTAYHPPSMASDPAPPPSPLRFRGSCLCGGIRYTLTRRPRRVVQCHCSDCQRDGGSDYQIMAEYRTEHVVVEDRRGCWKIYTIKDGTRSGHPKEKHFCGNCGCLLWTVAMKDRGELRMVRTSLVEDGLKLFPPTEVLFRK